MVLPRRAFSTEEEVKKFLAQYSVGEQVEVHYDPADPSDSVLIAGVIPGESHPALVGLIFALAVPVSYLLVMIVFGSANYLWRKAAGD